MAAGTDATTTPVVAGEGGFVSFSADQVRASSMIGQEIYGAENEAVGEVSDLILQEDGKTRAALVDVGGFLGIGEKRVAIPFNEIKMMQPAETAAMQTDPAAPAAGTADPAAPAAGGAGTVDPAAPAGAQTAATTEPRLTIAMTREQLEQLPAVEDQTATNATAEQPAAGGAAVDPAAPAADPNAPAAGADTQMAAGADQQFQPVTQELTADNLMGSAVIGANDESLGDVGDVVFDPNGEIQAVVVDVGGFLGIGEKPVAVQFDSLNVQKNGDGDIRLMLNASQEQLQNAPAYNADAAAAGQPQPTVQ
jgi:sporulation protein YlmC with PRC-barrel domain